MSVLSTFNDILLFEANELSVSDHALFVYWLILMRNVNIEDLYHQQSDALMSVLSHDLDRWYELETVMDLKPILVVHRLLVSYLTCVLLIQKSSK